MRERERGQRHVKKDKDKERENVYDGVYEFARLGLS